MAEPVQLYICYAEENRNALSRLEKQLVIPIAGGKIQVWHRGKLVSGDYRDQHMATHLDQAQIIIMLVSGSLFNPKYYNSPEMQRAFQLHEEQKIPLIPVIVEHCLWQDTPLGVLEPLPKGGKPAQDEKAWVGVVTEINEIAIQMQAEQAIKEPALSAKSSRPRVKSRKSASAKSRPFSGAAVAVKAPTTTRPARSTPLPTPTQPALPDQTLPSVAEPEPITDEARAVTPAYSQDYDQTHNGLYQIAFAILIWEPSQSTYDLIADERRAIYRALLDKRHQCTLGGSLPVPEGKSLQDCEITQAQASDLTVLLVEPQISPISELREFYYTNDDDFLRKILCYYPETLKTARGSWEFDDTLSTRNRLFYYQEADITNCQVRTKVLSYVDAMCIGEYRDKRKSRSGR
jgi:TIR domain